MTPLRQRMTNDMTVRGLAENTKRSYLTSVTGLARHYRRSPDQISAQEVQDYLIYLHEQRGLSWKSCNCVRHGVRFLYRITLGVPDPHFYVPGAKTPSTLPQILNHDELVRLFTVDAGEFIRRFLLHVLPRRFTRLRHYGLLGNRGRACKLALCRTLLAQPTPEPREPETPQAMMLRLTGIDITVCRACGRGTLRRTLILASQLPTVRRVVPTRPP